MDKQRILMEAQKIVSRYSFWMVSCDISHLYGYMFESGNTKYEIEIKFTDEFPKKPPRIKFYVGVKNLLGKAELQTIANWNEDSEVVDIVSEIRHIIEDSLKARREIQEEVFLSDPHEEIPIEQVEIEIVIASQNKNPQGEYIIPDLDAYPPDFEYKVYAQEFDKQSIHSESPWEDSLKMKNEVGYSEPELFETDQSSLHVNTELAFLQEEHAFDTVDRKKGKILLNFTLSMAKNYLLEVDFSRYPKMLLIINKIIFDFNLG